MRATRSASQHHALGQPLATCGRPRRRIVSASSPSAPIGVFSSWLMLATKSRRTVSTRRSSVRRRTFADGPVPPGARGSGRGPQPRALPGGGPKARLTASLLDAAERGRAGLRSSRPRPERDGHAVGGSSKPLAARLRSATGAMPLDHDVPSSTASSAGRRPTTVPHGRVHRCARASANPASGPFAARRRRIAFIRNDR